MPAFKQILFPVDFSEQSRALAPHVACMAAHYRARVTILHVIEMPIPVKPGWPEYASLFDLPGLIETQKQRLQSFLRSEFESVSTTRLTLEGDPGRTIADYADDEKVDLIMMPTHGYGPFRRFLLGSVTAKVLHDADCPVWTSAHLSDPPTPPTGYHNVLCAVDITAGTLQLLRWASRFAQERGAKLTLVHAIPAAKIRGALEPEGGTFGAFLVNWAREELTKLQKEAGTNLETVVEAGDVSQVVASAARAEPADLVVIGRGVMQHVLGRMRTNVYSIIRESPCPVISI